MTTIVSENKPVCPVALDKTTGELIEFTTFTEREQYLAQKEKAEAEQLKREKHSPFRKFTQLNDEYQIVFDKIIKDNPSAGRIFHFLIRNMDGLNAVVCSYTVIQEGLEISISTIKRAVAYLKENGYINVAKSGTTNVYIVNPQIAWKSWGTNYKYCKFDAKVILSATENKDLTIKRERQNKIVIKEK